MYTFYVMSGKLEDRVQRSSLNKQYLKKTHFCYTPAFEATPSIEAVPQVVSL